MTDMRLLTAAEMRGLETAAIASGEATGPDMMEQAGAGVVQAVLSRWPELRDGPRRAVVLCGPGNNGGDGYVIARLLAQQYWDVSVFGMGEGDAMPPDAVANRRRWEDIGEVAPLEQASADGADLIVDAVFGTGLSRGFAPPDRVGGLFHNLFADGFWGHGRELAPYVVAVDVPSGLDADSGKVLWTDSQWCGDIAAHLTVTFQQPKLGHVLADGPAQCGDLEVVDIGLKDRSQGIPLARLPDPLLAEPSLLKGVLEAHKFDHGHALVLTGGMGRTGAARLAARGALRIGAGLVSLGAPGSAMMECAAQISGLMLRRCGDADGLRAALEDDRINALCIGPGFGIGETQIAIVQTALEIAANRGARLSVVLDADALSNFSGQPDEIVPHLADVGVITPHGGEFARVFPDLAARMAERATHGPAYSKVDAAREAAERAQCVVVFKGADTVIAGPDGEVAVHAAAYGRAAPWLATAGSGDVLAGIITGLLARGFEPFLAAQAGVFLHVEAARSFGPGLVAEDLPDLLPKVLRRIEIDADLKK
ncbi:NAD(P)H-hydrate dehydratase [Gymnodinialimonas hymeniacidonis]|uniref:NAD(P)H-hydrate dehydratase n=1 Tax=Gymnodinialimonas hymeniacidonis TaxID=3126508 RepID=UPI0034C5B9A1